VAVVRRVVFAASLLSLFTLALALTASPAHADQESEAKEHFKRGVKLYNLGHFQEAIPEFEKAYDLDPEPILLFNIAQSHRQNGSKERALFFYRRYLEQDPNTNKRADVEQRMKELAQALQQENEQKQKPPTEVSPPPGGAAATPGGTTGTTTATTPGPTTATTPNTTGTTPVVAGGPPPAESVVPVRLAFALGPTFASLSGKNNVSAPVMFGLQLGASYDFLHGPSALRAGVKMLYAALPYTNTMTGDQQSSSLWGGLVTVDYAYRPIEQLSLGGGLAGGVVWWSGLETGNPFTAPGAVISGAIPMPTFGLSIHADYRFTPNFFATLNPGLLYSKTTSDGLTMGTSSITRFDLDVGVGYQF
jgi:hypothetical protein